MASKSILDNTGWMLFGFCGGESNQQTVARSLPPTHSTGANYPVVTPYSGAQSMKRYFLWTLIALSLCACSNKDEFSPDEEELQQANQVTIFEAKDSQQKWSLHADEVNFDDMTHAVLVNPYLLLRENGQDSATVSGKRGVLNYADKLVSIEGDAQVHSLTEKVLLKTDRFFYDIDKDRVWSDKKTHITRGTAKITAKNGIETDSKLRKIEFKKQSTKLPVNPNEIKGAVK